MTENKIDKDTARAEFDRFAEAMRLRIDREGMDENDRRDINEDIEILVSEIMAGTVVIDDENRAVVYPQNSDPLTFSAPSGAKIAVIDKKKESHKVGQQFAIIGALCNTAPSKIAALHWRDIDICATVVSLFFAR